FFFSSSPTAARFASAWAGSSFLVSATKLFCNSLSLSFCLGVKLASSFWLAANAACARVTQKAHVKTHFKEAIFHSRQFVLGNTFLLTHSIIRGILSGNFTVSVLQKTIPLKYPESLPGLLLEHFPRRVRAWFS